MKRNIVIVCLSMFVWLFVTVEAQQEPTVVQTLTFNDITKRRGIYTFPDSSRSYRKILMMETLKCDPKTTADAGACGEWDYLTYTILYLPDSARLEMGRYITPYGNGLDLGENGFTWVYDVTDYAPFLRGEVDLESGGQSELIDLKFLFFEGTPTRDVISVEPIWSENKGGPKSYLYRKLANDSVLDAVTLNIAPNAQSLKIKTRITGHGHNSDGGYPHCCEWKDNEHALSINGSLFAKWHIWRDDCDRNPVYPQGGTWPGSREGWCPGDQVRSIDFDITDVVTDTFVTIDYTISPVPEDNLGMGNGSYVMAFQLVQYGDYNFSNDAELVTVVRPTESHAYSRKNPSYQPPQVILRNGGKLPLTSCELSYCVNSNKVQTYTWNGSLAFGEEQIVTLPISSFKFWENLQEDVNTFTVTVEKANGSVDDNSENNIIQSQFSQPKNYEHDLSFEIVTNNYGANFFYTVKDADGIVVDSGDNFLSNETYRYDLDLEPGGYTIEFVDDIERRGGSLNAMGLYYWAYSDVLGSGFLRLRNTSDNSIVHLFKSDFLNDVSQYKRHYEFGERIEHSFGVNISSLNLSKQNNFIEEEKIIWSIKGGAIYLKGISQKNDVVLSLSNAMGRRIIHKKINVDRENGILLSLDKLVPGLYFLTCKIGVKTLKGKFIKL